MRIEYCTIMSSTLRRLVEFFKTSQVLESFALVGVAYQSTFYLDAVPLSDSLRVFVNDEEVLTGWTIAADPSRVVFDEPPPAGATLRMTYLVEVF